MNKTTKLLCAVTSLGLAASASATITVVTHETFNDDSLGAFSAVGAGAGSVTYVDGAVAGDRAVQFNGTLGLQQLGITQPITVGDGFGIEVIATLAAPVPGFSFAGGLTTGNNQGVGILEQGGWAPIHQGVGAGSSTASTVGTQVRLALVWAAGSDQMNGADSNLYIDGVLAGTRGGGLASGGSDLTQFNVGFNTLNGGSFEGGFNGTITEARYFTFANGEFQTSDLLQEVTVIPEPSSSALIGLGGIALILRRRK